MLHQVDTKYVSLLKIGRPPRDPLEEGKCIDQNVGGLPIKTPAGGRRWSCGRAHDAQIVVIGNVSMYQICATVADHVGFKYKETREACYMLLGFKYKAGQLALALDDSHLLLSAFVV